MKSNLVDIDVELVHQTPKAVLVHTGGKENAIWIPKSQCEIAESDIGGIMVLTILESLAIDKGLI